LTRDQIWEPAVVLREHALAQRVDRFRMRSDEFLQHGPFVGDVLDGWRVEPLEPDRRLVLSAEMRLPGRAWLEFEVTPQERGSRIRQTASFDPVGLLGLAYWYSVWPLHQYVFAGMLRAIAQRALAA
jgi:hypothetical protein